MTSQMKNKNILIKKSNANLKLAYKEFSRGIKAPSDMLTTIETLYNLKKEYINVRTEWLNIHTELYLLKIYSK